MSNRSYLPEPKPCVWVSSQTGPEYAINSTGLQKWRRSARSAGGVMKMDRVFRVQYADAVEKAVLAAQRSALRREVVEPRPNCASGTWHTTGEEIEAAIKARHRASLQRAVASERRNRTPDQWREMYEEAMAEKRRPAMEAYCAKVSDDIAERAKSAKLDVETAERALLRKLQTKYEMEAA